MSEVEELESRIRNLSPENLQILRAWFYEFENDRWDRPIEADSKSGKFDALISKARQEMSEGKAREL
jgi:hypothetical protein